MRAWRRRSTRIQSATPATRDAALAQSVEGESGVITFGLEEAARLARCHPDTLRKLAAAREVPGTKVGREWVFSAQLFQEWLDNRCRSIDVPGARSGGSALGARLAAQLERQTARRPRRSSRSSRRGSGGSNGSRTVVPVPGTKPPSAG